ncbi:MAG: hypothetical protein DWI00_00880 [Planctomycetota bacterium]|nr:MAG: hypothetical protein DWI00_00880 [Planctomycetota bacterium]
MALRAVSKGCFNRPVIVSYRGDTGAYPGHVKDPGSLASLGLRVSIASLKSFNEDAEQINPVAETGSPHFEKLQGSNRRCGISDL